MIRDGSVASVKSSPEAVMRRQRAAIERFAKSAGFAMVDWFNDPAVSGADPIETRPGFSKLLDRIEANGVRTVIVEDASRFARDLVAQELGVLMLIERKMRFGRGAQNVLAARTGPIQRGIRRAFIATDGRPFCIQELLARCYPATDDHPFSRARVRFFPRLCPFIRAAYNSRTTHVQPRVTTV
jgi:hypothetical protein